MKSRINQAGVSRALKLRSGASLLALGLAFIAFADQGSASAQSDTSQGSSPIEEVTVTGTRLNVSGYTAPTPVTTLGRDELDARAVPVIADLVYDLPAVKPAPLTGAFSQASGDYVSLRGLGVLRTLTLIDGHRAVPTNGAEASSGNAVDLNIVPTILVDRIDIVTGGASAAWGSDAVGGVVNVVLKHQLDGFIGDFNGGETQYGDAKNLYGALAWGTSFDHDRGDVILAGEYSRRFDMPTQADRSWSNGHCSREPGVVNGQAYSAVKTCGLTLNGYTSGGVITDPNGFPLSPSDPLYGKQFLSSTHSSPFNYGGFIGPFNTASIGGDGSWKSDDQSLVTPLTRQTLFARASYALTPNVTAFVQGSYMRAGLDVTLFENSIPSSTDYPIQILADNPYIPADIRGTMTANGLSSFYMQRMTPEIGPARTNSWNDVVQFSSGLNGTFGSGWSWDAYLNFGHDHYDTQYENNFIEPNLRAALDVVTNPATGQPDCRVNVFGPAAAGDPEYGAAPGCIPANPFGLGSLASAKKYIAGTLDQLERVGQADAGASVQGSPFKSWAGPVSVILGFDWRHEYLNQTVSPFSDFTNPPLYAGGGYQQSDPKSFSGDVVATEGYAETVVPLLADEKFAKSLDLNGAVRFTNYSTSGQVTTWKTGLTYKPIDGLLLRVSQSEDIRAASLYEMFGGGTQYGTVTLYGPGGVPTGSTDVSMPTEGNPLLHPENAHTTTVGATATDLLIPNLSVSVDYYKIRVKNVIGQLGGQDIVDSCYGAGTAAGKAPDPARCALINLTGHYIINQYLNLGTLSTDGIDVEASYNAPASDFIEGLEGDFGLRVMINYLHSLQDNSLGLNPIETAGDEAGGPHWRWTAFASYNTQRWGFNLEGKYVGQMTRYRYAAPFTFPDPVVGGQFYLNGSVTYNVSDDGNMQIYFNCDNLLNSNPPYVSFSGSGATNGIYGKFGQFTDYGGTYAGNYYDQLGRRFLLGIRFRT